MVDPILSTEPTNLIQLIPQKATAKLGLIRDLFERIERLTSRLGRLKRLVQHGPAFWVGRCESIIAQYHLLVYRLNMTKYCFSPFWVNFGPF